MEYILIILKMYGGFFVTDNFIERNLMQNATPVWITDYEEISIHRKDRRFSKLPARRSFGGHPVYKGCKENPPYPDLYKTFEEMSPSASWFWWRLNQHWDSVTGIAKYIALNKTEENKKSRAYKELKKMNLVHRVKRGEYLLNPSAAIPDQFDSVKIYWDYITNK
jgi:hypothetical protein